MDNQHPPALQVQQWLGAPKGFAPTLETLRGKVVLIEAFQMLCPGCVSHSLPQAQRVFETLGQDDEHDLVVLGLHTVFEHHDVQGSSEALAAFLHEYRLTFPVGIDQPGLESGMPKTMAAYAMRGTPSQILIGRDGRLRSHRFGPVADLTLGIELGTLLAEGPSSRAGAQTQDSSGADGGAGCGPDQCAVE